MNDSIIYLFRGTLGTLLKIFMQLLQKHSIIDICLCKLSYWKIQISLFEFTQKAMLFLLTWKTVDLVFSIFEFN